MSNTSAKNRKISELIMVLRQEKRAILSAQFGEIDKLNEEKKHLLEQLLMLLPPDQNKQGLPAGLENINTLTQLAKDNQILLRAARSGVESALERLKALGQTTAHIGAYDYRGNALTLSESTVTQQKHV